MKYLISPFILVSCVLVYTLFFCEPYGYWDNKHVVVGTITGKEKIADGSRGRENCYVFLRTEGGLDIQVCVRPITYFTCNNGDILGFEMSRFEYMDAPLWVGLVRLFIIIMFSALIILLLLIILKLLN